MLCSEEMQKRDSKNLPLSYYIFGAVNNSQLDTKSIGKSLVGTIKTNLAKKKTVGSERLGRGGGYSNARSKFITSPCRTKEF